MLYEFLLILVLRLVLLIISWWAQQQDLSVWGAEVVYFVIDWKAKGMLKIQLDHLVFYLIYSHIPQIQTMRLEFGWAFLASCPLNFPPGLSIWYLQGSLKLTSWYEPAWVLVGEKNRVLEYSYSLSNKDTGKWQILSGCKVGVQKPVHPEAW